MKHKKIILGVFVLLAVVQLFVPAKMILDRETVLKKGQTFKFKTAPVDPSDPFRGKYITLNYEQTTVKVDNEKEWEIGEEAYLTVEADSNGFAKISAVNKQKPTDTPNYFAVSVVFVSDNGSNELMIQYPFDRFYMEESKALDAELTYREVQIDTSKITYALVSIQKGTAVLKDVRINDKSIQEIVKEIQTNQNKQ